MSQTEYVPEVTCKAAREFPKKEWFTAQFVGWGGLAPKKENGIEIGGPRIKWRFDIADGGEFDGTEVLAITSNEFDTSSRGGKILKALGVKVGDGGVRVTNDYVRRNLVGRKLMLTVTSKNGQDKMEYWLNEVAALAGQQQGQRPPSRPAEPPPPDEGDNAGSAPATSSTPVSERRQERQAQAAPAQPELSDPNEDQPPLSSWEDSEAARVASREQVRQPR